MKKYLCILLITLSTYSYAYVPEPYSSIVDIPFDDQEVCINAEPLKWLVAAKQATVAIEVGSWLGTSTRYIASTLPEGGVVYAVDSWQKDSPAAHRNDERMPFLYQLFLSNIKYAGLSHKIIPMRMDSLEAAKGLNVLADIIYINGEYDKKDLKENILAWSSHLKQGGTICGRDWDHKHVQDAVNDVAQMLNKRLYGSGNFWWFE